MTVSRPEARWSPPSAGLALAVPASLAIARRRFRGRGLANSLLLMPLIVPGVVLGAASGEHFQIALGEALVLADERRHRRR